MRINIEKIFNKRGMRISAEAKDKFSKLLENQAVEYAKKLIKIAQYNGRKTVKKEDFKTLKSKYKIL